MCILQQSSAGKKKKKKEKGGGSRGYESIYSAEVPHSRPNALHFDRLGYFPARNMPCAIIHVVQQRTFTLPSSALKWKFRRIE